MHTGTLQLELSFTDPKAALFFNHCPTKLIVACRDDIFIVNVSTKSIQTFSGTPDGAYYWPHALALSEDNAVLVAGDWSGPFSASGYDTASRTRMWIYYVENELCAIGMHRELVFVNVSGYPMLVLDYKTGKLIDELENANEGIFGMGVIEGLCFFLLDAHILIDLHTPVYLAMLQHLLYKQSMALHLPLEMWDWIAKYRV